MYGFKALEEKYGIHVRSEGHWYNPITGQTKETFVMYTADECCWEKGLSRRGVKAECVKWEVALLSIKENVHRKYK